MHATPVRSCLTLLAWLAPTVVLAQNAVRASADADKTTAFNWIDANLDATDKLSIEIWNDAELSFREFKSSRALVRFLEGNGFAVETGVAGMPTAFVASFGSGKPVIAFYGEYDALADISQKPEPTRAALVTGAPGHACGHNLIGASTAAAAAAVAKFMQSKSIKGTLRFYGTPAEESGSGKNYMLEAGLFRDVDVLLGWHPNSVTRTTFAYSKAVAEMHFKFKGVAAHASVAPYLGRSALHGVELMDTGVNFLREQLKEDARIHYVISKGGGQPNVIPPDAESWYFIRANKHQDVVDIFAWVSEIAKGAAMMTRTQVEIHVDSDEHEVLPNRPLAEVVDRNLRLVGPPKFSDEEKIQARKMQEGMKGDFRYSFDPDVEPLADSPTQGAYSTDVGNVSWTVPVKSFEVASYPYDLPIHSWQVAASSGMSIGREAIPVSAKTLAASAIDLFKNPALVEAARKDFEERRKSYDNRLLTAPNQKPPVFPEP
jgi:aminobenzoyl-glutamate utilization protein B